MSSTNYPTSSQTQAITADRQPLLSSAYPHLASIPDPDWIDAINHSKLMEIPPKTELFSATTTCNNFILMLEGRVRVYQTASDGREITLYRIEPGGMCVLSLNSMLQKQPFNAIAETETKSTALIMS